MKPLPVEQWDGMRVLTVREPWASMIVRGWKDIENRSRNFSHRGPLLIHASATLPRGYFDWSIKWINRNVNIKQRPFTLPTYERCYKNRGLIIGGCSVCDCAKFNYNGRQFFELLPFGSSTWKDGSNYALWLQFAWEAFEPVPFKGQLCLGTFKRTTP